MAKKIMTQIKLQVTAGQANPSPPIGPALGQHGVNIGQFVSQFNERTKDLNGTTVPIEITVYADKSFDFIVKSPPAAVLLKMEAGLAKGSGEPHVNKVGSVTKAQIREISVMKFDDMNSYDLDQADLVIEGTARSMGIEVEG